jgi:hypothetical protein
MYGRVISAGFVNNTANDAAWSSHVSFSAIEKRDILGENTSAAARWRP